MGKSVDFGGKREIRASANVGATVMPGTGSFIANPWVLEYALLCELVRLQCEKFRF